MAPYATLLSILALPLDLLVEILTKVASASVVDICNVKMTCKQFNHVAEDDRVYHNVSIDRFPLVPIQWFTDNREAHFFKRCRESRNPSVAYREGMVQFLGYTKETATVGLHLLQKAAMDGHDDARYVCSMVGMNGADEAEVLEGLQMFNQLKVSTCIATCRQRVNCYVRNLWVCNPVVRTNQHSLCRSSTCGSSNTTNMMHSISNPWDGESEYSETGSCELCRADV